MIINDDDCEYFLPNYSNNHQVRRLCGLLFSVLAVIMGEEWFSDKWLLCELTAAMCTTACFCSFLSLTAVTINRYMYICHHKIYDKIFTSMSTIMVCLSCWVIAFGFEFPNLIGISVQSYSQLNEKVQVGKDQKKVQSEKDSHSKNRGGKTPK